MAKINGSLTFGKKDNSDTESDLHMIPINNKEEVNVSFSTLLGQMHLLIFSSGPRSPIGLPRSKRADIKKEAISYFEY